MLGRFARSPQAVVFAAALITTSCFEAAPQPTPDPLAGTYIVKGGGAASHAFDALAAAFQKRHPTVRFAFEDIGSTAGMRLAASGDIDLATSSATPGPDVAQALSVVPLGGIGTAVVVNAQNPVTALTKAQVRALFSGQTTDWSAVGGTAGRVVLIVRESSSAARSSFDAYFFGGKGTYAADAVELHTSDEIVNALIGRSTAVGILTVTSVLLEDTRLRALQIDGVAPTRETVRSGAYPVRRPLLLAYNPAAAKPAIKAFVDFVASSEGQQVLDSVSTGG